MRADAFGQCRLLNAQGVGGVVAAVGLFVGLFVGRLVGVLAAYMEAKSSPK